MTICLDMDECLVYTEVPETSYTSSSFKEKRGADAYRRLTQEGRVSLEQQGRDADFEIDLPYLEEPVKAYKRPLVDDFLQEMSLIADIVLFTTAADGYAAEVSRHLDPTGSLFTAIFSRSACRADSTGGAREPTYTKDLAALGRPLARTVMLDDNFSSFLKHPENGVPMVPFYGDVDDRALPAIIPLLRGLERETDVRLVLKAKYRVREQLLGAVRAEREKS